MTTDTDICNQALDLIGTRSTIASLQENSNEARACRRFYEQTRDAMIRGAHWNFARRTAYLTMLKSAPGTPENPTAGGGLWDPSWPPPPWLYTYQYPSDCLLMIMISPQIYNTGQTSSGTPIFSVPSVTAVPAMIQIRPQKFELAADTDVQGNDVRVICSNQDQAIGIYSKRVTTPDLWDPTFKDALAAALASRLCISLSGDKALKKELAADAMAALLEARRTDGIEGLSSEEWIPDWIRVRGFAYDWSIPGGNFIGAWTTPSFLMV